MEKCILKNYIMYYKNLYDEKLKIGFYFFLIFFLLSCGEASEEGRNPVNTNNDSQETATNLYFVENNSTSIQAGISSTSIVDFYQITLSKGAYAISTSGTSSLDPRCLLFNEEETILEEDARRGNCYIAFSFDVTEDIFFIQITNSNNGGGDYTLWIKGIPDLSIASFLTNEISIHSGGDIDLPTILKNSGSLSANSTSLIYYSSIDNIITPDDKQLLTRSIKRLSPREFFTVVGSVTGHNDGIMYYGVCVNAVADEFHTNNNCSGAKKVSINNPDLYILAFDAQTNAPYSSFRNMAIIATGDNISLRTEVKNSSVGSEFMPTSLNYYRSFDNTISTSDTLVKTNSISDTNSSFFHEKIYSTSISGHSSGIMYYRVCVNTQIEEVNKNNNCSDGIAIGANLPDLSIQSFYLNKTNISDGETISSNVSILNSGTVNSGSITLSYYISSDDIIDASEDRKLDTEIIPSLSNQSNVTQPPYSLTGHNSGVMYYGVCVDITRDEFDIENNCSGGLAVTSNTPDLEVSTFNVNPKLINATDIIHLSAVIINNGKAESSPTTLRYYRSLDTTIDNTDIEVSSDFISSIRGRIRNMVDGVESRVSVIGHNNGIMYYGACVDSELDEFIIDNNCSDAVAVGVNIPDLIISSFEVSPTISMPEGIINLSATVENSGTALSENSTLRYYRSIDRVISREDVELTTDFIPTLSSKQSYNLSTSITGHNLAPIYYGVCIDTFLGEFKIENNCSNGIEVSFFYFMNVYNIDYRSDYFSRRSISTTSFNIGSKNYLFIGWDLRGISVLEIADDGSLQKRYDISDNDDLALSIASSMTTTQIEGKTYLFVSGRYDDGISVFDVSQDGTSNVVDTVFDNHNLMLNGVQSLATTQIDSKTYLFAAGEYDDGISVFDVSRDGMLTNVYNIADNNNLMLDGAQFLTTTQIDSKTYLFAAGKYDDGISVFDVSRDGILTNVYNVEDGGNLELNGASSVTTAKVGSKTYLFAAGKYDDGISVFDVSQDGILTNVYNVEDGGNLELDGARSVKVTQIGKKDYLFIAGEDDDGISIFDVSKDGSLTNISNISDADDSNLNLNGVNSISTLQIGNNHYLFSGSIDDGGVSVFEMDNINNNSTNDAKEIVLGKSYSHKITEASSDNSHYYRIYLFTENYTIRTISGIDTVCELYSANNTTNYLASDDDSSLGDNCLINYNITNAGYYYIRVRGDSPSDVGNYTLEIFR